MVITSTLMRYWQELSEHMEILMKLCKNLKSTTTEGLLDCGMYKRGVGPS